MGVSSRSALQHLDSTSIGKLSKNATKAEPIHPRKSWRCVPEGSSDSQMQVQIVHNWLKSIIYVGKGKHPAGV
jgi:hypothetical protein